MTGSFVHLSETCFKVAVIVADLRVSPTECVCLRKRLAVRVFLQETKGAAAPERFARRHSEEYLTPESWQKICTLTIKRILGFVRFRSEFFGKF